MAADEIIEILKETTILIEEKLGKHFEYALAVADADNRVFTISNLGSGQIDLFVQAVNLYKLKHVPNEPPASPFNVIKGGKS